MTVDPTIALLCIGVGAVVLAFVLHVAGELMAHVRSRREARRRGRAHREGER